MEGISWAACDPLWPWPSGEEASTPSLLPSSVGESWARRLHPSLALPGDLMVSFCLSFPPIKKALVILAFTDILGGYSWGSGGGMIKVDTRMKPWGPLKAKDCPLIGIPLQASQYWHLYSQSSNCSQLQPQPGLLA